MNDREKLAALIGRNIRTLRGTLTQVDFGENVGILQGPISRYEKGLEIPGIQVLMKIAEGSSTSLHHVTVNDLIYGEIKGASLDAPKVTVKKPVKVKAVKKPTVPKPSKAVAKAAARAAALDAPDVKPKRKHHKPSVVSLQVEVKND